MCVEIDELPVITRDRRGDERSKKPLCMCWLDRCLDFRLLALGPYNFSDNNNNYNNSNNKKSNNYNTSPLD